MKQTFDRLDHIFVNKVVLRALISRLKVSELKSLCSVLLHALVLSFAHVRLYSTGDHVHSKSGLNQIGIGGFLRQRYLQQRFRMASTSPALLFVSFLLCCVLTTVQSAPIKITRETFKTCSRGQWAGIPADCCPPKEIEGPIIDFHHPNLNSSKPLRVRKALQCLSGKELRKYTRKLQKGYELMRALPDTDPRSYKRQYGIHCAYASGSLKQDYSNLTIDVHNGWYFHPWHRAYSFFHERILQWLLKDPEFTLHYWNYDNGVKGQKKGKEDAGCYEPGIYVPPMYLDPTKATYLQNRTAKVFDPKRVVDLAFDGTKYDPKTGPPVSTEYFPDNLTVPQYVWRNNELMHRTFIIWGNSTRAFMGKEYRIGDPRTEIIALGAGTQELYSHTSMHSWIGGKMFQPISAPEDPIFFPFHANLERLWDTWLSLKKENQNPTDSDWLNGEFLLYDENAVMNRWKVKDFTSTEALGYTYEKANDDSWIEFDPSTPYPSS